MAKTYTPRRAAKYLNGKIKLNTGKKITAKSLKRLDEEGRMFPAKKWPTRYSQSQLDEYINEVRPR